jgi:ABC-type Fe3+-hydroxamate transport system substrate-binding protein
VKQLAIIAIFATVVTSGQADATPVASRAECLSTCAPQIADACGGLRRAKYNRCRLHVVRQCRRFGSATMCPVPVPPAPPTTITTMPVATTTTLPPPGPWTGVWNFVGALYSSTCPSPAATNADLYTIVQTGLTVRVTLASIPSYVALDGANPDGSFSASGQWSTGICNFVTLLAARPTSGVIGASVPASVEIVTSCQGAFSCDTIFSGVLTRVR